MGLRRLDNVGVVVEDLDRAVAFFLELGLTLEARTVVDGDWAARVVGLPGQVVEIAMLRTPVGGGLELMRFERPAAVPVAPQAAPPNALGLRRVMFAVDDVDDTVRRLEAHGGALMGEIVNFGDAYRLCYLRGPEGLIVALAQELRPNVTAP